MQELVSSETLNNEEEIIVFEENLKGPKGDKGDKGDDGYTPKKGVDYFTENDKQELIEAVTEDASSEFVQIVNSKTTEFNNNATSKTDSFNSNATSKETSYNENATTKLNEYNENHTNKMSAYNDNATEKITEYNENAAEKIEEYDNHIEELDNIVSKSTANGESIYVDDALKYKIFDAKIDGNAKQTTTTGKNYFNAYAINNTAISVENDGQTIAIDVVTSGNGATSTHKTLAELCPNLNVGDQVVLRFNRSLGDTHNAFIYLGNPIDDVWIKGYSKTITEEMLGCEVMLYGNRYIDGETEQCIITDFTIMKSSETDTTFEPFTNNEPSPNPDYPQDITVIKDSIKIKQTGKNLYKPLRGNFSQAGVSVTIDDRNVVTLNGEMTGNLIELDLYANVPIQANKYYKLSAYKIGGTGSYASIHSRLKVGNNTTWSWISSRLNAKSSTEDGSLNNMIIFVNQKTTFNNYQLVVQVEEVENASSSATDYEEYNSNEYTIDLQDNELVKLTDDIKDEITIDKNGNVSLSKRIGKVVLNGTENWIFNESGTNYIRFTLFINDLINNQENNKKYVASDYFVSSSIDEAVTDSTDANRICAVSNQRLLIKLVNDNVMNLDDFKAWLSENNVTCYYQLPNVSETINLGQLTNFKTYEGVNHFFLEANIATNFEIRYAQDLKKVISKQQAEIDELKTLLSSTTTSALLLDNYASDLVSEIESEVEQ